MTNAYQSIILQHIEEHRQVLEATSEHADVLGVIAETLINTIRAGKRLYLFGNGGSAADAQHIAAEFVGRFKRERRGLPAFALTTDTSILTAVSNDYHAEDVFARQVQAHVTAGDAVWALSVSGRSPNVIRGLEAAAALGATCIGFTGLRGDPMRKLCSLCFTAQHVSSDRVQEMHLIGYHVVCDLVEAAFAA